MRHYAVCTVYKDPVIIGEVACYPGEGEAPTVEGATVYLTREELLSGPLEAISGDGAAMLAEWDAGDDSRWRSLVAAAAAEDLVRDVWLQDEVQRLMDQGLDDYEAWAAASIASRARRFRPPHLRAV